LQFLAIGAALGLAAGFVPGPFTALVARTALDKGTAAGLKVSLVPLVTEIPVMIITALVLNNVPEGALRWIGIAGGLLIILLAVLTFRNAGDTYNREKEGKSGRDFLEIALIGYFSPAPWIFWTLIAGPILLNAWQEGLAVAAAFVVSFFVPFIGSQMVIAMATVRGRAQLRGRWRVHAMRAMGGVLLVVGGVVIWQSYTGSFEEFIRQERTIQEKVKEAIE
jgi:threonine/homoserine/homoserine lactone efflux protein